MIMPEKYHIETKPVPPRRPRIGKYGIVDWREDCARCHNCVKKACVYDRYREEAEYIRNLEDVDALFFDCMGCFSCVQDCTKNLLCLSINPAYEKPGKQLLDARHYPDDLAPGGDGEDPGFRRGVSAENFQRSRVRFDVDGYVGDRPADPRRHSRTRIYQHGGGYRQKPSYLAFDGDKATSICLRWCRFRCR